nr:LuxR C-terminal-related transcriptional regulator [Skermanella mucosa]
MESCLVFRPRLEDCIARFDRLRLVLLSGPSGIGKTTLMARWHAIARNRGITAGWLSLHRNGHDPRHFLADLADMLEPVLPAFGRRVAGLGSCGSSATLEDVLCDLAGELDRLGRRIILFLDDYQAVTDPAVHRDVNRMLSGLPACFTLVIATRADPPLPLARLRGCGTLLELRASDLRFTLDEARYYLTRVQALDIAEDQVREVTEKTEGRISALQLAVLTRRLMAKERDALPEIRHRTDRWLDRADPGQPDGPPQSDDPLLRGFAAVMVGYAAGAAGDLESAMAQCRDAIEISGRVLETLQPETARPAPASSDRLHHREIQILRLVSEGLRNREIGERLRISEDTVKWYMKRLFAKLYVTTRTSAVARGREMGYLQ